MTKLISFPEDQDIFFCIFSAFLILGLDSEFALFETAVVTLYDAFPKLRNHKVKSKMVWKNTHSWLFMIILSKTPAIRDLMNLHKIKKSHPMS